MINNARDMSASSDSAKRRRLNYACNRCRQRKSRCDASRPKCSSCVAAGVECITTDPRRDYMSVERATTGPQTDAVGNSPSRPVGLESSSPALQFREADESGHNDPEKSEQQMPDSERPRLPAFTRLGRGDNRLALTHWLDLAFKRLGVPMHLTSRSQQPPPFLAFDAGHDTTSICRAFDLFSPEQYANHYCNLINCIFPLFTEETVMKVVQHLPTEADSPSLDAITACLIVSSVIWYLRKGDFDVARACIAFALANLHMIVTSGGISSVQICVIMALNLRSRSDITAASTIITLASAMAHNMGIHRAPSSTPRRSENSDNDRESWCWWSLYCIEKIISLELERPSVIRDFDCNQPIPRHAAGNNSDRERLWHGIVTLCQLQSEIVEELTESRSAEEQLSPDWNKIRRDKIIMCTKIDAKLIQWARKQPFDLSAPDASFFDPAIVPMFYFLATQYQHTLFVIQRNTLILNMKVIEEEMVRWMPDEKARFRVSRGAKICAEIARAIVRMVDEMRDECYHSIVFSEHALLLAIYTFAITVLRNSSPGMVRSDLQVSEGVNHINLRGNGLTDPVQLQARAIELAIEYRSHFNEPARSIHTAFLWELHHRVAARASKRLNHVLEHEPQELVEPALASLPMSSSIDHIHPQQNVLPFDDSIIGFEGPIMGNDRDYTMPFGDTSSIDILDWESLVFTYDLPL